MKKIFAFLISAALVCSLGAYAGADNTASRAVIGADLNDEQIAQVYAVFGIQRGAVPELKMTNQEERFYLEAFVDSAKIGTYSISCVFVELLAPGSGIHIGTSNVTWCTGDMYVNALLTAGVTDARIVVTAPFPVSGTAALAGVYKAYESLTGQQLDNTAKQVGTQELTITGELAEEIGSLDSLAIVKELKSILNQTKNMDDAELERQIRYIAQQYNVGLTDTQIGQLMSLCRSFEKLDANALQQRVEQVQNAIGKLGDTKDSVVGFFEKLSSFIESFQSFMDKFSGFFGKTEA